jgi:hypothetical protein
MISKRLAEVAVIWFDYLATMIIAISVAGASISVSGFPLQAQLFNPWPAIILLSIAFLIKQALHEGRLDTKEVMTEKIEASINAEVVKPDDTTSPTTTETSNTPTTPSDDLSSPKDVRS